MMMMKKKNKTKKIMVMMTTTMKKVMSDVQDFAIKDTRLTGATDTILSILLERDRQHPV